MLSFIIPAYNAGKYIKKCINSILAQKEMVSLEILVVDDGSTDNTGEIVLGLCRENPEIRYIYKENGGVSSARNEGIKQSRGEFIVFADSDDYLEKDFAETMLLNIEGHDLCVCSYNEIYDGKARVKRYESREMDVCSLIEFFDELYAVHFFNPVWNKIYRRNLIYREFDTNRALGEDLIFNLEYLKKCRKIKVIDSPLYNYQINGASVTQKYKRSALADYEAVLEAVETYCDLMGAGICESACQKYANDVAASIQKLAETSEMKYGEKREEFWKVCRTVRMKKYHKIREGTLVNQLIYNYIHKTEFFFPLYVFLNMELKVKRIIMGKVFWRR